MGYFSNGTEGLLYQEQYCFQCVHYGPEEGPGCPIWGAHLVYAYELCNDTPEESPGKAMLDMLIPTEGIENLQCRLFYPAAARALGCSPAYIRKRLKETKNDRK